MENIFTNENYSKLHYKLKELKHSEYAKDISKRIAKFIDYSEDEKKQMIETSELVGFLSELIG
jgi:hypothetical protein